MKSRKNKSVKKNSKRKTKKMRNMRGCYKKHRLAKKCNVCGYKKRSSKIQRGGNCGCTSGCNNMAAPMMGGSHSFYKPAAPIPGPFTGDPWGAKYWPGENGVGSDNNYYKQNLYHQDPQTMMKLGGKRTKSKKNRKRGGGLIPDSILNLGRSVSYNMGSSFNQLSGYPAPVNPLPYKDQLRDTGSVIV